MTAERLAALDAAMRDRPWQYLEGSGSADPEEWDELQDGNGEMVASNFSDTILPHIMDGRGCAILRNALPEIVALVELLPKLRSTLKGVRGYALDAGDPELDRECARQIDRIDAVEAALNAKVKP